MLKFLTSPSSREMRTSSAARRRGTTLVEILVVIVVFLVGILAIAQIFPGGLKILARTRNSSVALALARSQLEALKSRPDALPEAILPVRFVLTAGVYVPIVDETRLPTEYAPNATAIDSNGIAVEAGRAWQLVSGANAIRRVIGESHVIPSPRSLSPNASVAAPFGSLVLVEFGPIDHNAGVPQSLQVYGRDMYRRDASQGAEGLREYEYLTDNLQSPLASITMPAARPGRFRLAMTVLVSNGATTFRRTLVGGVLAIGADPNGFVTLSIDSIPGVLLAGETLVSVDPASIRIAELYTQILDTDPFLPAAPFTYKLVNGRIGMLSFNPALFGKYEERAGTTRQPYVAKIDYDVRDWRVIHEDFRVSASQPANLPKTIKLGLTSLRTNTVAGSDGRTQPSHAQVIAGVDAPYAGMEDVFVVNNTEVANANTTDLDNFLLIDLETGGQVVEYDNGAPTMKLDKTSGILTLFDTNNDPTDGLTQAVALPGGTVVATNMTGRSIRAYYMGKDEWAIQVLRNPARYGSTVGAPAAGQFYVGGTGALNGLTTRLYFPRSDANRKISIGNIRYIYDDGSGPKVGTMEGAEFQIKFASGGDSITQQLPSIDIRDAIPFATEIVQDGTTAEARAYSVKDVRGVSMLARVFYNSSSFGLTNNSALNLTDRYNAWAREWNVTNKETYLHRGESVR